MRRVPLLLVDLSIIFISGVAALFFRENLRVGPEKLAALAPYLIAALVVALIVFQVMRLNRTIWRFAGVADHLQLAAAMGATVLGAVLIAFAFNRLEGLARALPFLHILLGVALLSGVRILHRIAHEFRHNRRTSAALLQLEQETSQATVLIVGISRLTEAYLLAAAEFAPGRIKIAGLIGGAERHVGRLAANHEVLGLPEDIKAILERLRVHGVNVDRIVVATSFDALRPDQRQALLRVERSGEARLQLLAIDMGFDGVAGSSEGMRADGAAAEELAFEIDRDELKAIARRSYWRAKRVLDFCVALVALSVSVPLIAIAAALVGASVGLPVIFWQRRPGLGGRSFWVGKFRTMKASHDASGRRLSDEERLSRIGGILRRFRIDELPQLFSVLRGDMSIIGPRPLLPQDQSGAYRMRLLVRPGLTGWAQVVGGRSISPEDKAALDVWYVRNASLFLDAKIVLRTVAVVLFGERTRGELIEHAWRDLFKAGVVKGELSSVNGEFSQNHQMLCV
jgi:lipopolysaccharide/colanic/teichoic acid biosynthesis glycosyltransferase